jgi:hypothetical protein
VALAITVRELDGHEVLYETVILVPAETDEHTPVYAGNVVVQFWEEINEKLPSNSKMVNG